MKKITLFLTAMLVAATAVLAQTPNQFKYQTILRDADGVIIANEDVQVVITILDSNESMAFKETHDVTTDEEGLFKLNIGSINDLEEVDFGTDSYFLEVSIDGTVMSISPLLSVPYALQAKTAENVFSGDYNDLINKPDISGVYSKKSDLIVYATKEASNESITNLTEVVNTQDAATIAEVDTLKAKIAELQSAVAANANVTAIVAANAQVSTTPSNPKEGVFNEGIFSTTSPMYTNNSYNLAKRSDYPEVYTGADGLWIVKYAPEYKIVSEMQHEGMRFVEFEGWGESSSLRLTGDPANGLEIGKSYLVSYYIKALDNKQSFFLAGGNNHDNNKYRYCSPNMRRIVFEVKAEGTSVDITLIKKGSNPFSDDPDALFKGWIGGIQCEEIPFLEKRAVAFTGDSTMEGAREAEGVFDLKTKAEWSKRFGALMNFDVFNRGHSGERTDELLGRWASEMAPLAQYCKYAVIQGGINDLVQNYEVDHITGNLDALYGKAIELTEYGQFKAVMCTISPFSATTEQEAKRKIVNKHIRDNYTDIIDLDYILRNPEKPHMLRDEYVGNGDLVHFNWIGKTAIANYLYNAGSPIKFRQPSAYLSNTYW